MHRLVNLTQIYVMTSPPTSKTEYWDWMMLQADFIYEGQTKLYSFRKVWISICKSPGEGLKCVLA